MSEEKKSAVKLDDKIRIERELAVAVKAAETQFEADKKVINDEMSKRVRPLITEGEERRKKALLARDKQIKVVNEEYKRAQSRIAQELKDGEALAKQTCEEEIRKTGTDQSAALEPIELWWKQECEKAELKKQVAIDTAKGKADEAMKEAEEKAAHAKLMKEAAAAAG